MNWTIEDDCTHMDWPLASDVMAAVGWPRREPADIQQAFENSFAAVAVYHEGRLIAYGRTISDGVYQAAIYDVVVHPDWQHRGIGRQIVERLLQKVERCNVILYATPGKEEFYAKLGFGKMKTGMAKFLNVDRMERLGFVERTQTNDH
jgi:GNAT superfamily N-acetyltransferase